MLKASNIVVVYVRRFWSWVEWSASQIVQLARGLKTESVPQAAVFTACVPAHTLRDSTTDLSLYCSPNDMRRQLIDNEDDFLLKEDSAWYNMLPNDQAYVSLSGRVVKPVNVNHLENFFVR